MPAAERAPAFQCYADDHLTDGAELSNEEFGQYWKLVLYAWREVGLPSDPERIARIIGVSRRQFDVAWRVIGPKFELTGGRYFLPWQEDERQKQADNREKRVAAANARWGRGLVGADDTDQDKQNTGSGASKPDAHALQLDGTTNSLLPVPTKTASTTSGLGEEELTRRLELVRKHSKVVKFSALLPTDHVRELFCLFLVRASTSGEERVSFWIAKLTDWLSPDGMEGIKATPAILGTAFSDYATNGFLDEGFQPTARHFKAFVIYVRDGLARPVRVGSKRWKPGAGVASKPTSDYDTAGNTGAADALKRQLNS